MAIVPFDTLKLAQALRDKAHFTQEQAEGAADAMQFDLATKGDLAELVTKSELSEAKADIIKWVAGLVAFQTLAVVGTVLALSHH